EAEPEELADGDEVITRRWDFFAYTGPIDDETGEAKADEVADDGIHGVGIKEINGQQVDLGELEIVGNFIGAQMSAFDPEQQMGLIDHVQDGEIDTPYVDRSMVIGGTNPVTVSRNGALPTGMNFDTSTGILSGTPVDAGNYNFSLTATDGTGKNVTKNYLLKVVDPNAPVNLAGTTLSVTSIDGVAGTNATLSAKLVYTDGGAALAGRGVDFRIDGTLVGSGTTDASGNATCTWTIPIATASGAHTVTAEYAGDTETASTNGNGTLTVKVGTSTAITDVTTTYLAKVTIKGTLKANGVSLGGKSLTFFVDSAPVGTATTTSAGLSTITPIATQSVGPHTLTAEFAGDTTYAASASPTATLTIGKGISLMTPAAGSAKFGGNTTVKATLKVGSTPIAGETVDFLVDGTSVGTGVTNASGVASRTFKCLSS
ncbi:MAG: Ig-like domain repeat protein, partial [Armatimonadaceae bacterium]